LKLLEKEDYGIINEDFLENLRYYDVTLRTFFQLQYNEGLRYIEVYEICRWQYIGHDNYEIQTAKGGNKRIIEKSSVPSYYQKLIAYNTPKYEFCRYRTLSRYFNEICKYRIILCGDKEVASHYFRYNKLKQMSWSGMTVQEIAEYIGEVDTKNVQGYIDAKLYVPEY